MTLMTGAGPKTMLRRLREVMAETGDGQERLDKIVRAIAAAMSADVCSIYLKRDEWVLELCATEGLRPEAVHRTRLKVGHGLVGLIAERAEPFTTLDAPNEPGFEYRPETGEEIYTSFCGVPIQRLGRIIGVLVVQNAERRVCGEDEIDALGVIAMVIAEMAESGQIAGGADVDLGRTAPHTYHGVAAADGAAVGVAHLHEPKLAISQPFTDNVPLEQKRLDDAMDGLRDEVDTLIQSDLGAGSGEYREVVEAYRLFAHDKGWLRRLREAVASGVVAEVAVERVQSEARSRMERAANPYLRDRLHDLDDLANRLLRRLSGGNGGEIPAGAVLVARHIGPGEVLDYSDRIAALVTEEGAVASHAAIVARALEIPMVVGAERIVADAENGDQIAVDGDAGRVYLRPVDTVFETFREKVADAEIARKRYQAERDAPSVTLDGKRISLGINAGLLSDLPQLFDSGAEGVGLYRTELQFLIRATLPTRTDLAAVYGRVLDAAKGARVVFRTLDIGSDKVLPYIKRPQEDNPALGWRAVRVGLDKPHILKMQCQALLRGAGARPLTVMFPFIADEAEFYRAREILLESRDWLQGRGYTVSTEIEIGAMLETPSLAHASDRFFESVDFLSVGGNDLMQFFFAADRGNEQVRRRYDALNPAYLRFLAQIGARCAGAGTPLSFCGEAAGRPVNAVALAALGFSGLSMRAVAVGPVKQALRTADLGKTAAKLTELLAGSDPDIGDTFASWLADEGVEL